MWSTEYSFGSPLARSTYKRIHLYARARAHLPRERRGRRGIENVVQLRRVRERERENIGLKLFNLLLRSFVATRSQFLKVQIRRIREWRRRTPVIRCRYRLDDHFFVLPRARFFPFFLRARACAARDFGETRLLGGLHSDAHRARLCVVHSARCFRRLHYYILIAV